MPRKEESALNTGQRSRNAITKDAPMLPGPKEGSVLGMGQSKLLQKPAAMKVATILLLMEMSVTE